MNRTFNLKNFVFTILFAFIFTLPSNSDASKIEDMFVKALDTLDFREADAYTKENPDKIPFEIDKALVQSRDLKLKKKKRIKFLKLADAMANSLKRNTGDETYIEKVQGRYFEEKLSDPIIADSKKKLHVVKLYKKRFFPDNLTIHTGDTVNWLNKDDRNHTFRSSLDIGLKVLYSGNMLLGRSFKHTFKKPGEYYYQSIIYKKKMIGKITVLDSLPVEVVEKIEEPAPLEETEVIVETVPAEKPKESVADKKKRIKELLKKFEYQPDE